MSTYSFTTHTGDGSTTNFNVPFGYINKTDVKVYVDGTLQTVTTDYTWFNDSTIQFLTAPAVGLVIRIERVTSIASRAVDFVDGGNLTEHDLDTADNQFFFLIQEIYDGLENEALQINTVNVYDAEGRRITLVADPTDPQDAATKAYVDAAIVAAGLLPVINAGDADKHLTVKSDESGYEWTAVPEELPSVTGNANKHLIVNSSGTGVLWSSLGAAASQSAPQLMLDNGLFRIRQHDRHGSNFSGAGYLWNRWYYAHTITYTPLLSNSLSSTDVPTTAQLGGYGYPDRSARIYCLTADTPTTTEFAVLQQGIEGERLRHFYGGVVTVTFWVKSSTTGTFGAGIHNGSSSPYTKFYGTEFTINSADTWEKKTITLDLDVPNASNNTYWDWDENLGAVFFICLAAGASYSGGTKDAWTSLFLPGGSSQPNLFATSGNYMLLYDVQAVRGADPDDFRIPTLQEDLLICARYFQQSYSWFHHAGDVETSGAPGFVLSKDILDGSVWRGSNERFPVAMRAYPTMKIYRPDSGTAGYLKFLGGTARQASIYQPSQSGYAGIQNDSGFTWNDQDGAYYHWSAEADFF